MKFFLIFAWILASPFIFANDRWYPPNTDYYQPRQAPVTTLTSPSCNKTDEALKQCSQELEKLKDELKTQTNYQTERDELNNKLERRDVKLKQLEIEKHSYQQQIQQLQFENTRLKQFMDIIGLLLLTGGVGSGAWYLKKRRLVKPKPRQLKAQSGTKVMRYFNGTLRPDVPADINTQFQQQLLDRVKQKQAWDATQEQHVKQALENLAATGGNANSQIAAFLMDFWCPLLACYEADTQNWTWFKARFQAVCPQHWQVEIDTPHLIGKAFTEVVNQTDNMLQQGQQVKAVVRPGIALRDQQGNCQAERKAWVELH